jgi:hypothetical protein
MFMVINISPSFKFSILIINFIIISYSILVIVINSIITIIIVIINLFLFLNSKNIIIFRRRA